MTNTFPGAATLLAAVVLASAYAGSERWSDRADRMVGADSRGESSVTLVFQDEFAGAEIDPGRWTACYWWDNEGCTNSGNNELQWYLPEQAMMADGALTLRAQPGVVTSPSDGTFAYRSAMVTTGRDSHDTTMPVRFAFTYGLVEVRAKVPTGAGLWPAIWLLPVTHESRPEIDIMEVIGDSPDVVSFHLHTTDVDGERLSFGDEYQDDDLASGWHVFAIDWSPDAVIWMVDGVERWRLETAVPHDPLYLLLNLAVGGDWPGPPNDETRFPADFQVDYVRVWQGDGLHFSTIGTATVGT